MTGVVLSVCAEIKSVIAIVGLVYVDSKDGTTFEGIVMIVNLILVDVVGVITVVELVITKVGGTVKVVRLILVDISGVVTISTVGGLMFLNIHAASVA